MRSNSSRPGPFIWTQICPLRSERDGHGRHLATTSPPAATPPSESRKGKGRGIGKRHLACHHPGNQPASYGAQREAVVLVPEIQP